MSKSRGTFITARTFLDSLNPEYLRYYYAAKLSSGVDDIDLNLEDFMQRVNSDLVGKVVNIASRCAGFIKKHFNNQLANELPEPDLHKALVDAGDIIATCFENREYSKAVREIMALADRANVYIDNNKPWVLIKEKGQEQTVQAVCTQGINLFRILMIYLKPILPETARKSETFLNCELNWNHLNQPLLDHTINKFKPLMTRIEQTQIDTMTAQSSDNMETTRSELTRRKIIFRGG